MSLWSCWLFFLLRNDDIFPVPCMSDILGLNSWHFEYYVLRLNPFKMLNVFALSGSLSSSGLYSMGNGSNISSFFKAFAVLFWVSWKHKLGLRFGTWTVAYIIVQFSKPLGLPHICTAQERNHGLHSMHTIRGSPSSVLSSGIPPTLFSSLRTNFSWSSARNVGFLLKF